MRSANVTGLVLAGGLGRRMAGRDKGLVPWRGRPLVARVLERLAPQVGSVAINANRSSEVYAAFGHPVIADAIAGYVGPLAGLQAGLAACATPLLATAPCDAPLLPLDLVARLEAALESAAAPVAVAYADGRMQPTFLLCRRDMLEPLAAYLAAGGRAVHAWLETMAAIAVPFDDASAFANVNTPQELDRLPTTQ